MKVVNEVKSNTKLLFSATILLIIGNIVLSVIPTIFLNDGLFTSKTDDVINLRNVFMIVIFAPFFEETLMRGILQNWLKKITKLSTTKIYILIALIFSLLHLNFYLLPYFFTSLILSYSYDKSNKSLIVPILVHSFYNLFVVLFSIIQK